ncbi:MAG TPA: hypothetical protein VK586_00900 [Streptosporangiaceae bacterium]|nr:hypothetical protein [Streptosporangiaceae bacterium]
MSVGFPSTKSDFDSRAGGLVTALRLNLFQCSQFCALLQGSPWSTDANLTALGYTSGEVTLLKAAFTDLGGAGSSLYRIANGQAFVAASNNFLFNANQLCGVVGTG